MDAETDKWIQKQINEYNISVKTETKNIWIQKQIN